MTSNKNARRKRASQKKNVQYSTGQPTRNGRGSIGFSSSLADFEHVHSISNPFSPSARGSKLPDSDSSKSVAISLVQKFTPDTNAGGDFIRIIKPNLNEAYGATTLIGSSIATISGYLPIADYAAVTAQFATVRLVSFGVKIYSTLAPTAQSGYFSMITNPEFGVGADALSSFYEETLSYPTSEQTVQWISKPIGNSYLDYRVFSADQPWDSLMIWGTGLPVSTNNVFTIEVFYNLECQVALGSLSSAIATPAAPHKPHILAAVGETLKKVGGSKLAAAAKEGFMTWIKGALQRGATMARTALNSYVGSMTGVPALTNF